jgi:hypothetical protein
VGVDLRRKSRRSHFFGGVDIARKDDSMAMMEKPEPATDEIAILGRIAHGTEAIRREVSFRSWFMDEALVEP